MFWLLPRCHGLAFSQKYTGIASALVRSWWAAISLPWSQVNVLDEHPADVGSAGLADPAMHRRRVAGLTHSRVEPDIGDELVRVIEAGEVTYCGHDAGSGDRVDTGDRHQPRDHRIRERHHGQFLVHDREFAAVEVELAQQRRHRRPLIRRRLLAGEPVPPGSAEQVRHRRGRGEVAGQDRVDLVLDPGALAHQIRAVHHPPAQPSGSLIRQLDRRQKVRSQQLCQDAGVDLVNRALRNEFRVAQPRASLPPGWCRPGSTTSRPAGVRRSLGPAR